MVVAQAVSAPAVPWVIFSAAIGAVAGSLSAYYGLRLRIQTQGAKAMRAEEQIRADIKDLRQRHEDSEEYLERMEERSKFTLRLVADVARKMKVEGIDEEVIDHLTQDTG